MAAMLEALRQEHEGLLSFQSKLILFAQQITPYVDTKDRELVGLMRRINEDVAETANQLDWKVVRLQDAFRGLVGGFSGLTDEMQGRRESMLARERRYQAQVAEVQAALSVVQHASQTLKRELERSAVASAAGSVESQPSPAPSLDSYKYVGFEDQFRGSPHEIRERLAGYLPDFEGALDVVDIGCGRGEFLELLRERGIPARGVDINEEMAAICRERGLDATAGDALTYLREQPDASLGGLFAAQVVEHLEPDYLMQLLDAAYHKLRPGSKVVLETINPACWYAFFSSYIRDITHVVPLHPDTLRYLLIASGFQHVEVRFSAPFPEESKLQAISIPVRPPASASAANVESASRLTAVFNENVRKLNDLLFTHLDYAAIGVRV
jgi:O-antigen chain-terminating methyltransferase